MSNLKKHEKVEKVNTPSLAIENVQGRTEPVSIGEEVDKILANNPYALRIEVTIAITQKDGERNADLKYLVSDEFKSIVV